MRIGYLYDFQSYPPRGGNHVHALELTQGFISEGHSVAVVDDPTMPGVTNFTGTTNDLRRFVQAIDILYVRIDARFIRQWQTLSTCIELAENRPIVWEINSPANETLAYSWLGGKTGSGDEGIIRKIKRRIHATGKIPGIFIEEYHRSRIATKVTGAICVSKLLARYAYEQLHIKNVHVLPNGGPLIAEEEINRRRQQHDGKRFTVLYSGSAIYPWQGLDYLSRVIELAAREEPDMLFVLAVNQRTADLPVSDNVLVLENLDRDKILNAICSADACVSLHPEYPWSKYNFHNSPMKLFEYMACMRPVVTSNHGQMRDIIHHKQDGLLCSNDAVDILQQLRFLKQNPAQADAIGRKGWERIQTEFSWKNNVQRTLNIFEELLAA